MQNMATDGGGFWELAVKGIQNGWKNGEGLVSTIVEEELVSGILKFYTLNYPPLVTDPSTGIWTLRIEMQCGLKVLKSLCFNSGREKPSYRLTSLNILMNERTPLK